MSATSDPDFERLLWLVWVGSALSPPPDVDVGTVIFYLNTEDRLVNMLHLFTAITSDSSGRECGRGFLPAVR